MAGEKTLRGYTMPLDLQRFDRFHWMVSDDHLERIAARLDGMRRVSLLTAQMEANLSPVDERSYRAGLAGAVEGGLYRPSPRGMEEARQVV